MVFHTCVYIIIHMLRYKRHCNTQEISESVSVGATMGFGSTDLFITALFYVQQKTYI